MAKIYLIDGHAYLHRAYHALPPLTNSHGQPVNAVYGFLRMLLKIVRQEKPDALVVCFDAAGPTFRHETFKDYKATRKEIDEALVSQFPLAREAVQAMNMAQVELAGYEADDLIADLTRKARDKGYEVVIVTGDKDAMQLVGTGVSVLNEPKNLLFNADLVKEKYGVMPAQIPDIYALIGDHSDNVPGIPGIGEKTAVKLILEYGSLEGAIKAAPSISGKVGTLLQTHAETARMSRGLIELNQKVPLDCDWDSFHIRTPDSAVLTPFLQRMEFYALQKEIFPAQVSAQSLSKRDYQILLTEEQLKKWVSQAQRQDRLAVDVETNGLDSLHSDLVGISISTGPGMACYIPLRHEGLTEPKQLPLETVQKHLIPLLEGKKPKIYGHNLKFDALVLERHGIPVGPLHCDTMIASYVLNPSRSSHGLKDLVLELVGEPMMSIDQLIGKGSKQITMDHVPVEKAAPYACADADMTLRLADLLEKEIQEKQLGSLLYDMEMPLVDILCQMEERGILIDKKYLTELGKQLQERMRDLEQAIYKEAGETFNINSPKQLSTILFEKLKLPIIRRTKTGISTDEEVLQTLSSKHPLPAQLLNFREIQKLYSTYVEGLSHGLSPRDGRIHTTFNQAVAATGRLSSSNPNLQNIPIRTELGRQIRKAFIPEPGSVFLSADYSQIDLRVLAHVSQDEALCRAFRNGEDVHTATACEIFNIQPKDMTPELRRVAKSINFGIVYGISAFGLAQQLQIHPSEARDHIDRYFLKYTGVKAWIDNILEEARQDGYVKTVLGRVRFLPEILAKNAAVRGFAERTAMNTPIQGTSADIIKMAMVHLARAQEKKEWKGHMLVQVHDELLFEVPKADLAQTSRQVKHFMEHAVPLSIPVVVDLKVGPNWNEMEKMAHGV